MTVLASSPLVSVVFVCYRSSAFVGRAVESLRREARGEGVPLEVLIVDHSEDPREQEALQKLQPEALLLAPNRGYAAGLNLGLRHARGQYFIAANPDLTFAEGSLRALLAALRGSFAVVGPQFTMGPWLFPAADPQHPLGEVRTWLSLRWRFVWQRVWRSWVKNQE
ncbi:MAG: glycosyltransferase, partial [Thermoanaerobaculum sp.]|nr:glycosyltransferase [Thermoanaerobaculum sp.]